jgi:hypothetical protein
MNRHAIRSGLFLLGWSSVIFFTIAAVGQPSSRSLPTQSPPPPPPQIIITLTPTTATNPVGTIHTLTATVVNELNQPLVNQTVKFSVNGANITTGSATTNATGQATFTYTGTIPGDDTITAWIDEDDDEVPNPAEPLATATQTLVAEWRDVCVSQRMEITGIGMGDQNNTLNPQTLTYSTNLNWLLAQVAGRRCSSTTPLPNSVTFTTDTPTSITLNEPTRSSQYGYTFETAILQPTSQITAWVDSSYKTPRGCYRPDYLVKDRQKLDRLNGMPAITIA